MTLTLFACKSALRNKRRSVLTMVGTGFSLLLLCFLMVVWRSFYVDPGSAQSAQRLIMQHGFRSPIRSQLTIAIRFAGYPESHMWFRSVGSVESIETISQKTSSRGSVQTRGSVSR